MDIQKRKRNIQQIKNGTHLFLLIILAMQFDPN